AAGDTINTASRMESTGRPGAIHISCATRHLLPPEEDEELWAPTGGVEVKGKGRMDTVRKGGSLSIGSVHTAPFWACLHFPSDPACILSVWWGGPRGHRPRPFALGCLCA
ncbi:hypothetical protein Vretimale_1172, partial [Volvox reticuliferus]